MPPPNTEEFDMFNYGVENVCKIKEGDHPFEISVVASSDSDGEKDGDEDEDDQYEEEKQDLFWNMPPLLKLTFVSDRAASIAHGVSTVFPEAFHYFCARHLFGSIKTKSNKFKYFEWHYWKMVKAYRASDFEDHLSVFRRILRASYNYLEQVGFHKWSKSRAEHVRYSYLTINSVESVNALSKHARKLPSVSLTSTVTPYAERKLGKRTRKSRRWQAIPSTNNLIEVRDGRKNGMVNLDDKVCSCGQWQLSGIPCGHVIAAARLFGVEDVTKFESHWFTTQTYINTYLEHILPLPHRSEWSYPSPGVLQIVNPPIKEKRAPGRPKSTKRIPSKGEDTEKTVRTCTRCKEPGHGRDTCTASYDRTGESTSKRVVKTSASKSKKGKEKATDAEAFKAYQSQFYAT
ncbi:uncharacterized protein [Rutidosis leptorrhynchoides]|uniref:uncharacterized protein n=1 Tax=Rutidosis leptorrhynchoides TaxID=125765 RepID=UPI003A9A622F